MPMVSVQVLAYKQNPPSDARTDAIIMKISHGSDELYAEMRMLVYLRVRLRLHGSFEGQADSSYHYKPSGAKKSEQRMD